jgi:cytoskeleton protein RodZ
VTPVRVDAAPLAAPDADAAPPSTSEPATFGACLRRARETRGLDLESCGHALKLPVRVLRQLENDQREGIDHAVFLAGYIGKYARHLGLDEDEVQTELARIRHAGPALVSTGGISHSRYLFERYATAATYVVQTAVIIVPVIWLGVRGALDRDLRHLAPLDAAPVAQQEAMAHAASAPAAIQPARQTPTSAATDNQPLMASMAPFPDFGSATPTSPQPASPGSSASVGANASGHVLSLSVAEASWVEVIDADGTRLEYGLLPAGSSKTYRSERTLEVRVGNAAGAQVSIDGQPMALDGYRHANVAHFRVRVQDGKAVSAAM